MSVRPLPCPFCGQQPTVQREGWVACEDCISKHIICSAPSIKVWNARATDTWQSREGWEAGGREGAVWVVYRGSVKSSYYSVGKYWFTRNSRKCYSAEDITHVMRRQKQPVPPSGKEVEVASQAP